jgi:hypothetical protein
MQQWLDTSEIRALFEEEIGAAGGTVSDRYDDGRRLFLRSVFSWKEEVGPRDKVQGGVALRGTEADVCVRPYVFRVVCRNGAIRAHALQGQLLRFDDFPTAEEAAGAIRDVVRACCDRAVLADGAAEMRSARFSEADMALDLAAHLSHFAGVMRPQVVQMIFDRFAAEGDHSRFGLMNAVTATARDTADPELRWRLEELGGGVPVLRRPEGPRGAAAARTERRAALLVS